MSLTIKPLNDPADPAFQALLDLYRISFPPEEQKSPSALADMLRNPIYTVLLAWQPSSLAPAALAITAAPSSAPILLLEYLATAPALQGLGIGRTLFTHIATTAQQQHRPILLEVETAPLSNPNTPQASRQRFYRSLGARQLRGLAYRMPTVAYGEPPPMHLFLHDPATPATVPHETLRTWLSAIYAEIYHQPPDDPRIADMLTPLPTQIPFD